MNIRVLIAEASPFRANVLSRAVQGSTRASAVGLASSGEEAVLLAHRLKPDVIILDVSLPALRGPLATRQILDHVPARILVTAESSSVEETEMAFMALDEGAISVMARPASVLQEGPPGFAHELVKRVELISRARLWSPRRQIPAKKLRSTSGPLPQPLLLMSGGIGGVQSATCLLRRLSGWFRGSVLMIQSLEEGFLDGYARWLERETRFGVEVCRRETVLKPRSIYLASENAHLVLRDGSTLAPSRAKPHRGHRPSLTTLARSAVEHYRGPVAACVLSGEGHDGLEGLKLLRKTGGAVLAQDPESCLISETVDHAKAAGEVDFFFPPDDPRPALLRMISSRAKTRSA